MPKTFFDRASVVRLCFAVVVLLGSLSGCCLISPCRQIISNGRWPLCATPLSTSCLAKKVDAKPDSAEWVQAQMAEMCPVVLQPVIPGGLDADDTAYQLTIKTALARIIKSGQNDQLVFKQFSSDGCQAEISLITVERNSLRNAYLTVAPALASDFQRFSCFHEHARAAMGSVMALQLTNIDATATTETLQNYKGHQSHRTSLAAVHVSALVIPLESTINVETPNEDETVRAAKMEASGEVTASLTSAFRSLLRGEEADRDANSLPMARPPAFQ